MKAKDVFVGKGTLQEMNREIEANKAAIAELISPVAPIVPDRSMSRVELVALAGGRGVATDDDMNKREIIEAIEGVSIDGKEEG